MQAAASIFVSLGLNKKDTAVRKEAKLLRRARWIYMHTYSFSQINLTFDAQIICLDREAFMNIEYLTQYISYHLHTIVRTYTKEKKQSDVFCARVNFQDLILEEPGLEEFLLDAPSHKAPLLSSIQDHVIYATLTTPDHLFVVGPVCLDQPVYIKHQLSDFSLDASWKETIFSCEFNLFLDYILLMHNLFYTTPYQKNELIRFNCIEPAAEITLQKHFSELLFENQEIGEKHNPYDQEVREFSSIENGSIEQLEQSWAEDYMGKIGTLSKDKLRNLKNIGIVIITLASRSAIRGGVNPEIAFSLSDIYIMKIEEAKDEAALEHIHRDAEYKYTMMVHEIKEHAAGRTEKNRNPRISKCKDFIFEHLHEKIYVAEIAAELDMNPKYLSDLFKQCEGISITDFILKEKINLTQNLLVYSKYSYIEIATYLGFSSQSHLGKQFKKITGMTLKQYRDRYGVKEFI
jgi:AraC-type DNA-binding domain-containing proteins